MPRSKSSQKSARVAQRRRARNKSVRSEVKTYITKAERRILRKEPEPAKQAVVEAIKVLDKAAKKGVIHPNNAARRKSRLMKKFNCAPFLAEPEQNQVKGESIP